MNYVTIENFAMYQNKIKMELIKLREEIAELKNEIKSENKEETKTKVKGK